MSELTLNTTPRRTTPTTISEVGGPLVQYDGNFWKSQNTQYAGTTSIPMTGYEGFNVKLAAQDTGTTTFKKFEFDNGQDDLRLYSGSRSFITTYEDITFKGKYGERIRVNPSVVPYLTGYDAADAATITTIGDNNGTVEVYERWPTEQAYASGDNDNGESLYDEERVVWGYEPMTVYFTDASVARTFPISGWFIDYGDDTSSSLTTVDPTYHPANEIVTHENLFTSTYQRANTYYATLYNEASTTATKSANVFRRASSLLTDTLNTEVTCRIDVYPWNQTNDFFLISGESVSGNYTADYPTSASEVTTNGGTFISGYAPNLTVTYQESCTPVSFPISSYHWDFGDVFRSASSNQTVCATDVQTGFGNGWITDETNHYKTYSYRFPGIYNVSLGTYVSADPEYNPQFAFELSAATHSKDMLVYVEEIDPQASFNVAPASGGPWGQTVAFTSSPMTVCFNASATIAGSFEIGRVVYDFGDGTTETVDSDLLGWTPADISTEVWFDAADTDTIALQTGISQWDDKSGNNNHLTQSGGSAQPEYGARSLNGITVPNFDGSNDHMDLTTEVPLVSSNFGREVWAVFIVDSHATTNLVFGKGSGNVQVGITPYDATGDAAPPKTLRVWCCGTQDAYATNADKSDTAIISGDPYFAGWLAHNDFKEFSVNGNFEPTTGAWNPSTLPNNSGLPLATMGQGSGIPKFDGIIAEAIITSDTLTTDERQKMEAYLARKWGLQDNLPQGHPYGRTQDITICHEYTRTLVTDPSSFNVSMSAYAYNTDTMDTYTITGLGPLTVTPTASAVTFTDFPQHLLAESLYGDDELLYVFEGENGSTFNYLLEISGGGSE